MQIISPSGHTEGKYHCMADFLFIFFAFGCFAFVELATYLLVCIKPNQSNRRSAI